MNRRIILPIIGLAALIGLSGNDGGCQAQPDSAVDKQREQAAAEVAQEQTYCYECQNIKQRRILFGKPGVIGYVVFLNQAGQPIRYIAVQGKCTSSGKRLTQQQQVRWVDAYGTDNSGSGSSTGGEWAQVQGPSEDGTFGSFENYVYCFGDGRYWQWSGDYLYSDKPFDLTIKPPVVDTASHTQHQ